MVSYQTLKSGANYESQNGPPDLEFDTPLQVFSRQFLSLEPLRQDCV